MNTEVREELESLKSQRSRLQNFFNDVYAREMKLKDFKELHQKEGSWETSQKWFTTEAKSWYENEARNIESSKKILQGEVKKMNFNLFLLIGGKVEEEGSLIYKLENGFAR